MTWLRQVLHVAAKDIRHVRWQIAAYVAIVAAATWYVVGPLRTTTAVPWTLLVIVGGIFLVALLVQADSPSRVDAFWRSRPLDPLAVLGAKVVIMVVLTLLGMAGHGLAIHAHQVGGSDFIRLSAEAGATYLTILLSAALVAALTRDMRSFLLAMIGAFISSQIIGGLVAARFGDHRWVELSMIIYMILAVLLMAWQYRSHRRRWGAVAAILLIIAWAATPSATRTQPSKPAPQVTAVAPELRAGVRPAGSLAAQLRHASAGNPLYIPLEAAAGVEGYRYVVRSARVTLHRPGSVDTVAVDIPQPIIVKHAPISADTIAWLGHTTHWPPGAGLSVELTADQLAGVRNGTTTLHVDVTVVLEASRVLATLPLMSSATVSLPGARLRISDDAPESGGVQVSMSAVGSHIALASSPMSGLTDRYNFALVNRERSPTEGAVLAWSSGHGGVGNFVLPGSRATSYVFDFRIPADSTGKQLSHAWVEGSELLVAEWRPVGSYGVGFVLFKRGARIIAGSENLPSSGSSAGGPPRASH